jgi:hypothetical protein
MAGALLTIFAIGAAATFTTMNRIASRNRTAVVAQAVLQNYADEALAASYTAASTPAILATTADGTDIDGDSEGDGELYASDVPLLMTRDSKTTNTQNPILVANIYRHCTVVNSTLQILRVSFLIRYRENGTPTGTTGKPFSYRLTILKARDT